MTVLAIEHTSFTDTHVTVTAVVDEMRLLYRATRFDPEEWAPAFCQTTIELDPEEPIPLDEDGFCILITSILYLDHLDPQWQLLDKSDE
jgi:hypothetical protein